MPRLFLGDMPSIDWDRGTEIQAIVSVRRHRAACRWATLVDLRDSLLQRMGEMLDKGNLTMM